MLTTPILKTLGLYKNFGALQAVMDVNIQVAKGSIHSIIGPNGAGKTTLFNLLTGFLKPSAGRIYFKEKDITNYEPHRISKMGISRSFQITSIFPELSVLENVRIAVQSRTHISYHFLTSLKKFKNLDNEAIKILEIVNLADKIELPAKYLSHGERKVLDIAIGMAIKPDILLLDEPMAGLVGDEITHIKNLIKDIVKIFTVVLVEHNIDVVLSISDTITVLYYGTVVAEGSPQEIQNNKKVQEIYLGDYRC